MISTNLYERLSLIRRTNNSRLKEMLKRAVEITGLDPVDYLTIFDLADYTRVTDIHFFAALFCLFASFKEGSLCLNLTREPLLARLALIDDNPEELYRDLIDSLPKYKKAISFGEDSYRPLLYIEYNDTPYLYFQKYYLYEKQLKYELDRLLDYEGGGKEYSVREEAMIKEYLKESGLNTRQQAGAYLALRQNFLVISGGPGTGKTSIVAAILELLLKLGYRSERIMLAAPTGRATRRINESLNSGLSRNIGSSLFEASTIHRLLKYLPAKNSFYYNKKNPLDVDVVIVDEVSMLDVVMMAKLLEALPRQAKLICLGDKDQLPSVEAGAVLAELIPADEAELFSERVSFLGITPSESGGRRQDRVVILQKSYRARGQVLEAARLVNEGDCGALQLMKRLRAGRLGESMQAAGEQDNCLFVDSSGGGYKRLKQVVLEWLEESFRGTPERRGYFELVRGFTSFYIDEQGEILKESRFSKQLEELFYYVEQLKILVLLNEGMAGTKRVNAILSELCRERVGWGPTTTYFPGMPLIILKNDYLLRLFNGDTGVVIRDRAGRLYAIFRKGEDYQILQTEMLPPCEAAFAITVHKSQGSEYGDLLLVLPDDEGNQLLCREIIYTGLTRAKGRALIYGREEVLKKAISRKINRESGITLWQ